jgi:hypothetical protein
MRYVKRWSNGYWKTFDTVDYNDVRIHDTEREATESASRMNANAEAARKRR